MFPPARIVCLTEETVETLYLLGEQDRIVGVSGYVVRPPEARKEKPRVSAFISADVPKILALEPDLVTDFAPKLAAALLGDARRQETGGDAAGLEDDDLPLHQAEVQEHLGNPGRLTRTGRRTEDDPPGAATGGDERFLQGIDG